MADEQKKKVTRRIKKSELYAEERNKIIEKMNTILDIKNDKGFFYIDDISEEKRQEIIDLGNDVKKYFSFGTMNFFKNPDMDYRYVSLIKSVYKELGYNVNQAKSTNAVKNPKVVVCISKII